MTSTYDRQGSGGGLARRGPPLASIESLLSFEAKSTPRSEFGNIAAPGPVVGDDVNMETVLPVEDFQILSGEQQSEEIFRLLSMLSPFAGEVSGLKTSIDTALTRISELDGDNKFSLNLLQQQTGIGAGARTRDNCSITAGLDNDIDQDFPLLGYGNKELGRDHVESPHSGTPLLPEINAPDPFIIHVTPVKQTCHAQCGRYSSRGDVGHAGAGAQVTAGQTGQCCHP